MLQPEVAIIIPTLNEEVHLAQCLDSVLQQCFPFQLIELFIIDGGSADRTLAIAREFAVHYPNIHILHNARRIQAAAFNIGVARSSAPYLIRLDAHSIYAPDYIERCVKHLKEKPKLGAVGGRWLFECSEYTPASRTVQLLNQSRFALGGASFRVGGHEGYSDTVPYGAFHRHVLQTIGGMREDLRRSEDTEFFARIRHAGYRVWFDPKIRATYIVRPTIGASNLQMLGNGVSIGKLFRTNPPSVALRHMVPFTCLCVALVLSVLSIFFLWPRVALFTLVGLYLLANIAETVRMSIQHRFAYPWLLSCHFFTVHLLYAVGTLMGILGIPIGRRARRRS